MKKPNIISTVAAVAACKLTRFILRKTGRGGTAVPGLAAMKLCPNILCAVSDSMRIVAVTGTNGKTTSCNMIEHALSSGGCNCLLDKAGANMLHGIAADLISNASWLGKPKYRYAVLEVDEAALKLLVDYLTPKVIVVTNLFSDQVDRFGGAESTLKEIRAGILKSPRSTLVLNADEPLSASLGLNVPNRVIRYGLEESVGTQGNVDLADAGVCPECGGAYTYDYHIYAHLGGYRCSSCGYKRISPDIAVTSIDRIAPDGSTVHMKIAKKTQEVKISLPAVYNVYNAAGAVAAAISMGVERQTAIDSLSSVRSSFGRLETFTLNENRVQMILVKNTAGCNQALSYLTGLDEDYTAVLSVNNQTGDGHDYSWINDTDYEKLCADPHLKKLYVGGECKNELYERLMKAGAAEDRTELVTDYDQLVKQLEAEEYPIFILPNYTAMMEIRQALKTATGTKDFWE